MLQLFATNVTYSAKKKQLFGGAINPGRILVLGARKDFVTDVAVVGYVIPATKDILNTVEVKQIGAVQTVVITVTARNANLIKVLRSFSNTWEPRAREKLETSSNSGALADKIYDLTTQVTELSGSVASLKHKQTQIATSLDLLSREVGRDETNINDQLTQLSGQVHMLNTSTATGELNDAQLKNLTGEVRDTKIGTKQDGTHEPTNPNANTFHVPK